MKPTVEQAKEIFAKYNETPYLYKHAQAVSGVMKYFAQEAGEDEELWAAIGYLHDIDYDRYPDEHCVKAKELLEAEGLDGECIRAVLSHAYGSCSDVAPELYMEKVLFAIDELTGLIMAAALMRPSKSVMDLEVKSMLKKFKTPTFAAKIDRGVIERGAVMLNIDLETLIGKTIMGMREIAEEIGF